jgi:hypothetical protein
MKSPTHQMTGSPARKKDSRQICTAVITLSLP